MNKPDKLVLATGNQGKVKELSAMLTPLQIEVLPQSNFDVPEVAETGTTFVENAIIKARHAAQITGLPAIADDSGLAVDALGGAPGIYSARYAGTQASDEQNIEKLLRELSPHPAGTRQARFICALVFMRHSDDPTPLICQGEWQGEIAMTAQGDEGFGYDPVFYLPTLGQTAAQLSGEQKSQASHRGQALRELISRLERLFD